MNTVLRDSKLRPWFGSEPLCSYQWILVQVHVYRDGENELWFRERYTSEEQRNKRIIWVPDISLLKWNTLTLITFWIQLSWFGFWTAIKWHLFLSPKRFRRQYKGNSEDRCTITKLFTGKSIEQIITTYHCLWLAIL